MFKLFFHFSLAEEVKSNTNRMSTSESSILLGQTSSEYPSNCCLLVAILVKLTDSCKYPLDVDINIFLVI
jgi:hypothetical protein